MKSIKTLRLILFILTTTMLSGAQESTFNLKREIQFTDYDSDKKTITVQVAEHTEQLYLSIKCVVHHGSVAIAILSPSGEKKGDFAIESQLEKDSSSKGNNSNEIVEGSINQNLKMPEKGNWTIQIVPQKSMGFLRIETKHFNNN